ncbi:MAG: alpha-galactosidase [Nocardioidaceae bacterium]
MQSNGRRGPADGALVHLRAAGVSVVVDLRDGILPTIVHWGKDLGVLSSSDLEALALLSVPPVTSNTVDSVALVSVVPEHSRGWFGTPGITGHRDGADWSPEFVAVAVDRVSANGVDAFVVQASDSAARLGLSLNVELTASGLLRLRATLRNDDPASEYVLDGVVIALPVPTEADELLDLTGGHTRERIPQRQPFTVGRHERDNRRGRTGTDATLLVVAGAQGFGFERGEVWGVHVGWSGNHRTYAERSSSGESVIGAGELLMPGEIVLQPGAAYDSPWVYGSYGDGLDELSHRFHAWLRSRPQHPTRSRPRPVTLNTWEAVYMHHDQQRLFALAEAAAAAGVERFVLDDGWFHGRRDDTTALGDWYVDRDVYPEGLHPLARHVRGLGLEFGLWVEPEMVSPDSDLARAHPEWILRTGGREPLTSRHQQVLDLGMPEAYAYVLERLDALLTEYPIGCLKWDHNRDLHDAGHGPRGTAGVHLQTLAVYRLMDELRTAHPHLEIESCSSGGGRVDLGVVQRAERIWASDCNDALERQRVQRWSSLLLPPEMIGSHIGPPRSHTTGRTQDLSFRAGTALFGHMGIEWDITGSSAQDRAELARWVALHKRLRGLLHSERVVRSDHADPDTWVHGVVASDGSEAVYAVVAMAHRHRTRPGRVRLPGLRATTAYRLSVLSAADPLGTNDTTPPPWLAHSPVEMAGSVLSGAGLECPSMHPEHMLVLHVQPV